jgi:alkylhydroperoxidase/carboxymuconolactone decarboxylase family protein YurZ
MATGDAPVLETLADINAVSLARTELDAQTLLMVRIGALVAVGAPPASYLMHIGPAIESGVTVEQVQDVLVTVAPITGAPRVLTAASNIAQALGVAVDIVNQLAAEEAEQDGAGRP